MDQEEELEHIRAEAASWLARVRSGEATARDLAAFHAWMDSDERHREAFNAATDVFEAVGAVRQARLLSSYLDRTHRRSPSVNRRAMLMGTGAAVAAGAWVFRPPQGNARTYVTGIGEQHRVSLDDGSMIVLDTSTSVMVVPEARRRLLRLASGRAHFAVVKDPSRPFVVIASDRRIVALGTSFNVEREENDVSVVLVSGRVAVGAASEAARAHTIDLVSPGDRLRFAEGVVKKDTVDLAVATAWQKGQIVFIDQPVADAVAEMNRYSRRPILIEDADAAGLRVSGTYGAGDTDAFSTSLATLLPLRVRATPAAIMIEHDPSRGIRAVK